MFHRMAEELLVLLFLLSVAAENVVSLANECYNTLLHLVIDIRPEVDELEPMLPRKRPTNLE